jgi:nitrite reductase (NADH) small subunit
VSQRIDACGFDELADGSVRLVTVARRKVALCRVGDDVFAVKDACPHFGGPLSGGKLHTKRRELICPWHRFRFDLADGCSVTNRALAAKTYLVTVDDGRVYVTV